MEISTPSYPQKRFLYILVILGIIIIIGLLSGIVISLIQIAKLSAPEGEGERTFQEILKQDFTASGEGAEITGSVLDDFSAQSSKNTELKKGVIDDFSKPK